MEDERLFFVGDIHGCLGMLKRLMDKIHWRPEKDALIFLGDYIDRGEDSKGVVDYLLEMKRASCRVRCLMGNHEELFLDYLTGGDIRPLLLNGGIATLESYQIGRGRSGKSLIPPEHLLFFKNLELWIELDGYYVVHAGFKPGVDIPCQSIEDMTWIRDAFIFSNYNFGKRVIFGHTPFREPLVMHNKIGLDTGAVYGNKLTCLEMPDLQFHFVEA